MKRAGQDVLLAIPLNLGQANGLVARWHRHHRPAIGHRFSIGAITKDGRLVGAAIVGRPLAKTYDQNMVAEVTRLVTDGTPNACSFLYGRSARAAQAMGFTRIQTYTLDSEPGTSLRAAGWTCEGEAGGGCWRVDHRDGQIPLFERGAAYPTSTKLRWAKAINPGLSFKMVPEQLLTDKDAEEVAG